MIRMNASGNAPMIVPVWTVPMTETPPRTRSATVTDAIAPTSSTRNHLLGLLAEATKPESAWTPESSDVM